MRWDMDNCLAFCSTCHRWQTENPLEFNDWFEAKFPGRKQKLQAMYNKAQKMTIKDYQAINDSLSALSSTPKQ